MIELAHNGVFIIDAVNKWYQASEYKSQPFQEWWEALSPMQKNDRVLQVLATQFGGVFPRD